MMVMMRRRRRWWWWGWTGGGRSGAKRFRRSESFWMIVLWCVSFEQAMHFVCALRELLTAFGAWAWDEDTIFHVIMTAYELGMR